MNNALPTLTFDGCGINDPDKYRSRLATFTSAEAAKEWGPLLASAPALLEAAEAALTCILLHVPATEFAPREMLRAAIAAATQA